MESAALLIKTALAQPGIAGKGLFLNAAPVPGLRDLPGLAAQTPWRDVYLSLARDGVPVTADVPDGPFDYILCDIPKSMAEAEGLLSQALRLLRPGGVLMAAAANDAGGRRIPALFEKAGLAAEKISKARCTLCIARKTPEAALDDTGALRPVLDGAFTSRPGIFGWEDVDIGSALLAQALPALSGAGADFGCGYGYLTRAALARGGGNISAFYSADADSRAVEACRLNCPEAECLWLDLSREALPKPVDFIVMNPPFHKGKSRDIALGQAMTEKAAAALKKGGTLWMVANSHLPYEDVLGGPFRSAERLAQAHGYKIFRAVK